MGPQHQHQPQQQEGVPARRGLASAAAALLLGRRWSRTSAAAAPGSAPNPPPEPPTHLIVFVNGLYGSSANWDVICEELSAALGGESGGAPEGAGEEAAAEGGGRRPPPPPLLHASQANSRTGTYDGIDVCGGRLAEEVRSVAAAHPSLTRVSFVGHSLGGLIARCVACACMCVCCEGRGPRAALPRTRPLLLRRRHAARRRRLASPLRSPPSKHPQLPPQNVTTHTGTRWGCCTTPGPPPWRAWRRRTSFR